MLKQKIKFKATSRKNRKFLNNSADTHIECNTPNLINQLKAARQ